MTTGLDGKAMTYDGENRPLSVTFARKKTCHIYGADGTRLKKIENFAPAQSCHAPTASQTVTLCLGGVEIRRYGQGSAEEILLYPTPAIRIARTKDAGGNVVTKVSTLHRDALGSVRAVTTAAGDFGALRSVFDTNGDGRLTADAGCAKFKVFVTNADGTATVRTERILQARKAELRHG